MQAIERDPERGVVAALPAQPATESACGTVFRDWGQISPTAGTAVSLGGTAYGIVVKKYPVAAFFGFILILFLVDFLRIRALKPLHDMETDLQRNRAQMDENQKLIEDQRKTIIALEGSLGNVKSEFETYTKAQSGINQERDSQLKRIDELTKRLEAAQAEYQQLKGLYDKLEEESKKTAVITKELQVQLEEEKKATTTLKGENEKLAKNIAKLASQKEAIDKENSEYAEQVEKHDEANNQLKKQLEELSKKVDQIKKEKEELIPLVDKAKHLEETNNKLQEKLAKLSELEVKLSGEIAELRKLKKP